MQTDVTLEKMNTSDGKPVIEGSVIFGLPFPKRSPIGIIISYNSEVKKVQFNSKSLGLIDK